MNAMKKFITVFACLSFLAFLLVGCNDASKQDRTGFPPETTDELFSNTRRNVELEIFKEDGRVYTVEGHYEISELAGYNELKDGRFYTLTADITYLNGGVAGYVDYPQIDRVISIEESFSHKSPE